jgi:hypothetical protein
MTVYQPQERHDDPDHPERVQGDRDVAPAEEPEPLEEQHEDPDHRERVENETDGAAAQERDHPAGVVDEKDRAVAQEPDHPEQVDDDRDGDAAREAERPDAISTGLPGGEGAQAASMAGEQAMVLQERDGEASRIPAAMSNSPRADFQVFGPGEPDGYHSRWESIQLGFVDDPKAAATEADTVVGELLGRLTERRRALRDELNRQSEQDVDTESMRVAVRNYRALFQRLVGS